MKNDGGESWNVDLQFRSVRGRSLLGRQYVAYPYHITRLLYDDLREMETPKLILQSLSGGIYRGERLWHKFVIEPSAKADVRTQGSTIVHNARGGEASSTTEISVDREASIFYIPEPQILFNGANFENTVSVRGVEHAEHVIVADSFLAYDPNVKTKNIDFQFTMSTIFADSDGVVIANDKSIVDGLSHQRVMNGYKGYASFMLYGGDFDAAFVRACCNDVELLSAEAAYSTLPREQGYVLKALAADGVVLGKILNLVRARGLSRVHREDRKSAEQDPNFVAP